MPNWLLPENIADVLPSEARKIEELRRRMLDNFRLYGYELVMPPLLEYVESLLAGGLYGQLAARSGALVSLIDTNEDGAIPLWRLLAERALCVNTTAAGGNASLMTLEA